MKKGWEIKTVGDYCLRSKNHKWFKNSAEMYEYIDLSSVCRDSLKITSSTSISSGNAPSRAKKIIEDGDVIFATTRPTLRRVAQVTTDYDKQICSTGFKVMRPKREKLNTSYLFHYIQTEFFMKRMEKLQRGASYPAVTDTDVKSSKIPIPPLPEQKAIVAILDKAFAAIDQAKANLEQNITNAKELFQSKLNQIFSQKGDGWAETKFIELCEKITVGYVGSMKQHYRDEGISFLRSQNVRPLSIDLKNLIFVDPKFEDKLGKSRLYSGDVAIVRTGYPGTAAVIPESLGHANCSDLVIVRPGKKLNPHFVVAFFNSPVGKKLVGGQVVGAAQKHFNVTAAKQISFPYPALHMQTIIVEHLVHLSRELHKIEYSYQTKLDSLEELKNPSCKRLLLEN